MEGIWFHKNETKYWTKKLQNSANARKLKNNAVNTVYRTVAV